MEFYAMVGVLLICYDGIKMWDEFYHENWNKGFICIMRVAFISCALSYL